MGHVDIPGSDIGGQNSVETQNEMKRQRARQIQRVRDNDIEEVYFSRGFEGGVITLEELQELAKALDGNTSVKKVYLNDQKIGPEGMHALAPVIGKHPNIEVVTMSMGALNDEAMEELINHIRGHPSLKEISISENPAITDQGYAKCAILLEENPNICRIGFGVNDPQIRDCAEEVLWGLGKIAIRSGNRNLLKLWPSSNEAKEYCEQNAVNAREILEVIQAKAFEELSTRQIVQGYRHLSAMQLLAKDEQKDALEDFKDKLAAMPNVPEEGVVSWDDLIRPNPETGFTPLDNPAVWKNFATICKRMDQPPSKADLMKPNRDAGHLIYAGIESGAVGEILEVLHQQQNDPFTANDLIWSNGAPSFLLSAIMREYQTDELFTHENAKAMGAGQVRRIYQALPEEEKQHIPNYHGLISRISSRSSEEKQMLR